ncbi:mannosyltransferase putative-domain-containing protein [Obelidium mucronatum]|nr:mannosyltransferase putative-domain-containing protein [Obelidium mucronatum]KAI9350949.1 mannosyltransferase putative-domain-containing protein [Obelidium mucronatum]
MAFKQSDFLVFGYHARNLRIFHALTVESPPKLEELKGDETQKLLTQAVDVLTKNLYPWLPSPGIQDLSDLTASFKTKRGIVFTFPTSGYPRGVHLILTLRNILNCTLPIEIFYNGDSDLSADKRQQLANLPGSITLVNTEERLPRVRDVNGYSIKPFVILASSFQEVIFLDDDVTLFQNPDTFLENSELWKTYGSIFFLDRSFSRGNSEWVRTFLTVPSLVANTGRYMTNVSRDEQESSFVALDKGKVSILHSLLSACHMNLKEARDDALQKYTHGDKESFWIAHEMLRVPYKFVPGIGGAAGFFRTKNGIQEPEVICGPQSHIDEKGRLIHFNGLVLSHKDDFTRGYIDFHHFAAPIKNNPGNIDIGYHPWCVHTREPEKEVHEFNAYEKETIGKIIELHKKLVVSDFKAPASG